jgi:hypothetical protein
VSREGEAYDARTGGSNRKFRFYDALGDRLGFADLIVALIALAAFYFWLTNKWIGSIALVTAYGLAVYGSLWK